MDCDALRDDQWERIKGFVPGGTKGKRYPRTTLSFVAGILDRSAPPPRDLGQVIDSLLQADPEIGSEPAFWRIRQMLRAD